MEDRRATLRELMATTKIAKYDEDNLAFLHFHFRCIAIGSASPWRMNTHDMARSSQTINAWTLISASFHSACVCYLILPAAQTTPFISVQLTTTATAYVSSTSASSLAEVDSCDHLFIQSVISRNTIAYRLKAHTLLLAAVSCSWRETGVAWNHAHIY